MRNLRLVTLLFGVLAFSCAWSNKLPDDQEIQSVQGYSDVPGVELEVSKEAPDFTLINTDGVSVSLSDFRGSGVVLIFYRGHWCPFCVSHLEDIQAALPTLVEKGMQVIAISPDSLDNIKSMANRMDNQYQFLSDPELEAVDRYGIRRDKDLPHPAMVVIDGNGIVQWFYVGADYQKRPSASQLMQVIERIGLPS